MSQGPSTHKEGTLISVYNLPRNQRYNMPQSDLWFLQNVRGLCF